MWFIQYKNVIRHTGGENSLYIIIVTLNKELAYTHKNMLIISIIKEEIRIKNSGKYLYQACRKITLQNGANYRGKERGGIVIRNKLLYIYKNEINT